MSSILITGGTGYIGSHTVVALISAGYDPVIVDNLSNSKIAVLGRIEAITGKRPPFYQIDLRDGTALDDVFQKHAISAAIHFAGLKAVGESVAEPLRYYENNIESTISLCFVMAARGVKRLIFSSSATVYGDPHTVPIRDDFPLAPANPYGRTKIMIEQILQDLYAADPAWQIALLRYFNPVGAHPSGLIGEDPGGHPNKVCHSREGWNPHPSSSTWAPARATVFSKCYMLLKKHQEKQYPIKLQTAAPETSPPAMPIRRLRKRCWVGRPTAAWKICAPTLGAGNPKTRQAIHDFVFINYSFMTL